SDDGELGNARTLLVRAVLRRCGGSHLRQSAGLLPVLSSGMAAYFRMANVTGRDCFCSCHFLFHYQRRPPRLKGTQREFFWVALAWAFYPVCLFITFHCTSRISRPL